MHYKKKATMAQANAYQRMVAYMALATMGMAPLQSGAQGNRCLKQDIELYYQVEKTYDGRDLHAVVEVREGGHKWVEKVFVPIFISFRDPRAMESRFVAYTSTGVPLYTRSLGKGGESYKEKFSDFMACERGKIVYRDTWKNGENVTHGDMIFFDWARYVLRKAREQHDLAKK
jgi:hypothetical protein